jgi:type III secretion protein L
LKGKAFIHFQDLQGRALLAPDPAQLVLKAHDHATWLQAQDLLDHARQQAQTILDQAQAAHEAERQRGWHEGMEQALFEQSERMIEHASKMVDYFSSVEQQMVGLVMGAVRKIVMDFDDLDRVTAVVANGLAVLRNQKQITLRLPPDQVEPVRQRAATLLERFPGVGMLDFVADSRLKNDSAILESEIGVVEASIEQQLAAIEQGFQKVLGARV